MSTQTDFPITPFVQSYISKHKQDILNASTATGVPAVAIAMAIANEMRTGVYLSDWTAFVNRVQDWKVNTYSSAYLRADYNTERISIDQDILPKSEYDKFNEPFG
jgi:hypothetical protein